MKYLNEGILREEILSVKKRIDGMTFFELIGTALLRFYTIHDYPIIISFSSGLDSAIIIVSATNVWSSMSFSSS